MTNTIFFVYFLIMKRIYLDYAATTPIHPEVVETLLPFLTEQYGNPSSIYAFGREAKNAIEEARAQVAQLIQAQAEEIYFTSGGTEANNFALKGVAYANQNKGRHIITSAIEHHAVLEPSHFLQQNGFNVTYLPVDQYGVVKLDALMSAIKKDTILISVMHANNEIGTIEPIKEIGTIAKEHGILFHTDAVQTAGTLAIDVNDVKADLLSISAHKIYGPKGVGALFIRKGTRIIPFLQGGGQERHMRASTENVPGIVGFGKAASLAVAEMLERSRHSQHLRDKMIKGLFEKIEEISLNGHPIVRLPNNVNIIVRGVEGESMLLQLDLKGIAASSGSACTSGNLEPSHVLKAIGIKSEEAHSSLRFTVGRLTAEDDIDYLLNTFPEIVKMLRKISPFK